MMKQIVEINGGFYLRTWDFGVWSWRYADKANTLAGESIYYWLTSQALKYCKFETLETLEKAIEEYKDKRMKLKEVNDKVKEKNKPKVIKTYWFKKL